MTRIQLPPSKVVNAIAYRRYAHDAKRILPFTPAEMSRIKSRLSPIVPCGPSALPPHTAAFTRRPASEAAILIPLMNINSEPHVLLEVRAAHMRSHAGEIRYALYLGRAKIQFSRRKDRPCKLLAARGDQRLRTQDDTSVAGAALRETYEELGIIPDHVEVLGMLDRPEYSLGNRARVWPVVVSHLHSSASDGIRASYTIDLSVRYCHRQTRSYLHSRSHPSPNPPKKSQQSSHSPSLPSTTIIDVVDIISEWTSPNRIIAFG
jgi:8-oxo-dGTP pyrophosphatase MutT (NUDIX family)